MAGTHVAAYGYSQGMFNLYACLRFSFLASVGLFGSLVLAAAQEPTSDNQKSTPAPQPMEWIATQITQNADKVCGHAVPCTFLVTDFVLHDSGDATRPQRSSFDNGGSVFGHQLADRLSAQLATSSKSVAVVDRFRFQEFLSKERLSTRSQNDMPTARWIAKQLHANVVIVGEIEKTAQNQFLLSIQFADTNPEKTKGLQIKQQLTVDEAKFNLDAPYYPTNSKFPPDTIDGETVYANGVGISLPTCSYMPNPPFTEEANHYRFSGSIKVDALLGTDGKLGDMWISSGAPYGLSRVSLATLKTWRCTPAHKDGKPVPFVVMFEINFRHY